MGAVRFNHAAEIAAAFNVGAVGVPALLAEKAAARARTVQGTAGTPAPGGSPPGVRSGALLGSITASGPTVSADGGHALFLEEGTVKMDARPFLLQSALDTRDDVEAVARAAVRL